MFLQQANVRNWCNNLFVCLTHCHFEYQIWLCSHICERKIKPKCIKKKISKEFLTMEQNWKIGYTLNVTVSLSLNYFFSVLTVVIRLYWKFFCKIIERRNFMYQGMWNLVNAVDTAVPTVLHVALYFFSNLIIFLSRFLFVCF